MIPILLLLTRIPDSPHVSEKAIRNLFEPEMEALGIQSRWGGGYIMSAGPYGATMFYRFHLNPVTADELSRVLDYAQDIHHDMITVVMRNNFDKVGSPTQRLPSYVSYSEWHSLDDLVPTNTSGLSAKISPEECQVIDDAVSEWERVRAYIDELEVTNRILLATLSQKTIDQPSR